MGYILVNPRISNSTFESSRKDSIQAADDIWSKLSRNIKHYTPKFYFTIQNKKNSKLIHFEVNEEMEGGYDGNNNNDSISSTERNANNRVKCTISEFKNINSKNLKQFLRELKKEQEGGGAKFLDDSSSSSSSIVYNISPNATFAPGIFPLTYYPTIYGVPNVLLPPFTSVFTPFSNIVFV
jgi:hypothetical protein